MSERARQRDSQLVVQQKKNFVFAISLSRTFALRFPPFAVPLAANESLATITTVARRRAT